MTNAFAEHVEIELISAAKAAEWPLERSWDDLLVVVYGGEDFPATGNAFIEDYLEQRPRTALLLPVAIEQTASLPPGAANAVKALEYDVNENRSTQRLVNRVGGMLGLRLQGRDKQIFISYRRSDGSAIANQLYTYLQALGHQVWRDEAQELDGETKILPGSSVQDEIDKALNKASLVLLLDTPATPGSPWIRHEVNTADAMLLPILPICFRDTTDVKIGPRFRSLLALQRWVSIPTPAADATEPLNSNQLDKIALEIETYLCEIFRRKCRVPFIVKNEFISKGFNWNILDTRLLMYESSKRGGRLKTRILSHCSIFNQIYGPSIMRFHDYLTQAGQCNYSLFIYDGELLTESELEDITEAQDGSVIILHHQELAPLLSSNFSSLGAR
ncbi:toll/interleukin-1 receptor domain-containing protein [Paraburkholderia fungorum]|uniref:toll/interleukin-1 receptor domain-containing protein n=2 Tax=Pseudomonadota TaxID=1224 RepID=UPI0003FF44E1|nr:toll/interleukin-1 receptor domain-containing protein [Paraburkholderia fungorum]